MSEYLRTTQVEEFLRHIAKELSQATTGRWDGKILYPTVLNLLAQRFGFEQWLSFLQEMRSLDLGHWDSESVLSTLEIPEGILLMDLRMLTKLLKISKEQYLNVFEQARYGCRFTGAYEYLTGRPSDQPVA